MANASDSEIQEVEIKDVTQGTMLMMADVKPLFSDGLIVQYASEAFLIYFLKHVHPISDEVVPDKPQTRAIAQIVVTPTQMAANLQVMLRHYLKFATVQEPEIRKYLLDQLSLQDIVKELVVEPDETESSI